MKFLFDYKRAMAVAEGLLIDVSEMARVIGYRDSVMVTKTVWDNCVRVPEELKTEVFQCDRLFTILWMSLNRTLVQSDMGDYFTFKLHVKEEKERPAVEVTLKGVWSLSQQYSGALTVMSMEE